MAKIVEAKKSEECIDLAIQQCSRNAAQPSNQLEVFSSREMRIQMGFFRNVTEASRECDAILEDVFAVKVDFTFAGINQSNQHFYGGALSRAVGAQISEDLPGTNVEGHVLHCWNAAVSLGQMPNFQHDKIDTDTISTVPVTRLEMLSGRK